MSFMHLNSSEIAFRLLKAVKNTLESPEMLAEMVEHGYNEPELQEMMAQANAVYELETAQISAKGDKVGAVDTFKKARHDFHRDVYVPHLTTARLVFAGDAAAARRLGLKGDRAKALWAWIEQARCFYDNALASPDLMERLATRRILQAHLEEASAQLETLAREASAKEDAKGLALEATKNRDKLARDLARWLSVYREMARIAFADRPGYLVRLGFRARRTRKRTRPKDEEALDDLGPDEANETDDTTEPDDGTEPEE